MQVVVLVDAVHEEDPGLGVVVGGAHERAPKLAGVGAAVGPGPVGSLAGAGGFDFGAGLCRMPKLDVGAGFGKAHEFVGDGDRKVEVGKAALVFGADEFEDVRVVGAQDAHLGSAPGAGAFDGFAGAVEDAHVGDRPAGEGGGALDARAFGADLGEVVADAASAAHGFGGLGQGGVDAGGAVGGVALDLVGDRLHEAIDERCAGDVAAGGRKDPPCGDEAVQLGLKEGFFPAGRVGFVLGEGFGDALLDAKLGVFVAFGVFFKERVAADFLLGQVLGGVFLDGLGACVHFAVLVVVASGADAMEPCYAKQHVLYPGCRLYFGGGGRFRGGEAVAKRRLKKLGRRSQKKGGAAADLECLCLIGVLGLGGFCLGFRLRQKLSSPLLSSPLLSQVLRWRSMRWQKTGRLRPPCPVWPCVVRVYARTRKSSLVLPLARCGAIQRGIRPRPAQPAPVAGSRKSWR